MNPITHSLIGWSTAHLAPDLTRREVTTDLARV